MLKRAFKERIDIPTPNGHASTLAVNGGETLMAWFGGTREGAADVDIYMAIRTARGWGTPFRVAGRDGMPHWNPVFHAEGDRVELYYKVGQTIPGWETWWMRSEDGGHTFCEPEPLVPGDVGGRGPVRNKPIHAKSGSLLAPASIETASRWDAFVDIRDEELRWRRSAFVPLWREGEDKPTGGMREPFLVRGKGVIQPTLWEDQTGVHMLLRSTEGRVLRSDSADGGYTWSPAYDAGLPNNNSGLDLTQLPDGRIALVLNPVSGDWAPRSPLSLYLSDDGGDHFTQLLNLEVRPGEYSYPAVLSDGNRLYVSYTWNRLKMAYWELELEDR